MSKIIKKKEATKVVSKKFVSKGKGKKRVVSAIFVLFIIFLLTALYLTFVYKKPCNNLNCFENALFHCNKVKYINDIEDITWSYKIQSKTEEHCIVQVEALQVKKGTKGIEQLEGKKMLCYVPRETVIMPETDISNCHGILKEQMQLVIIEKLHKYIIDNVGEIKEELRSVS